MIAAADSSVERRLSHSSAAPGIALAGVVAAGITVWAVARSPVLLHATSTAWLRGVFVAFYVELGAYTLWRRRDSRLGLLLAGVGFFYALTSLNASGSPLPYTVGRLLFAAFVVYLAYVFLSFPRDRLGSKIERWFVGVLALATASVWVLALALADDLPPGGPFADCGSRCPSNAFQLVSTTEALTRALVSLVNVITALALAGLAILLVRKARSRSRLRRRAIGPLLYAVIVLAASYSTFNLLRQAGVQNLEAFRIISGVCALGIPLAMLVGQIQGRVFAATSLGQLVAEAGVEPVTPRRVETLLGDALGDPTLALALWSPERVGYMDVDGTPVNLPTNADHRAITRITREGLPEGALLHDPSLDEDAAVLEGLAATALMLLENTRLIEELRASRARIVSAGAEARLSLERDLHDGAQQRLMNIQIRLAETQEHAEGTELATELEEIGENAAAAVEELRLLAHGIYPTLLRERGLGDGLRSLAQGAPIPVRVDDRYGRRCAPPVEAAVYFCCAEAIQNAIKHAGPEAHVTIALVRRGNDLEFDVADHGAGFEPGERADGVGLVSMRDRIGAVGGGLVINSSPGEGTSVRGTVPVGGPASADGGRRPSV